MNILITGCLGHIGSFVTNKILKNKKIKKIYLLDNNLEKLNSIIPNTRKKKIQFIYEDLTKPKKIYQLKKVNCVIHLASITNAENSLKNKKIYYKNNLNAFKNIIDFCNTTKANLIHISSTSVYGTNDKIVYETSSELFPQSPYAAIKLEEEKIIKNIKKKFKFITLRFGTICGFSKGIRFHTAINKFCLQSILGQNISVWNTALYQYRPYLTLADAFKTINYIINKNFFPNDIFNIVSENKRVIDILDIIRKDIKKIKIKLTKSPIMNQLSYNVSKEKIEKQGIKLNGKIASSIKDTLKKLNFIKNA